MDPPYQHHDVCGNNVRNYRESVNVYFGNGLLCAANQKVLKRSKNETEGP